MKILVIYDSFFGNTEKIAQGIGNALSDSGEVKTVKVNAMTADQIQGVQLLVVGSPTRAFRPTKEITSFLNNLPKNSLAGIHAAAFDTRADIDEVNNKFLTFMVKMFGYGADPIAKILHKKGAEVITIPEGFFITASEGPLREGELERAAAWAKGLSPNQTALE